MAAGYVTGEWYEITLGGIYWLDIVRFGDVGLAVRKENDREYVVIGANRHKVYNRTSPVVAGPFDTLEAAQAALKLML